MPTDRETELDLLERELRQRMDRPYVERPDEMNVTEGSACFIDRRRTCGADCAAFVDPSAPTAAERCTLLSGINTGLAILSDLVQLQLKQQRPVRAEPASIPPPYVDMRNTR